MGQSKAKIVRGGTPSERARRAPAQGPKRRLAPKRSLTLTDEAWAALGRLAGPGGSRSAAVERLALAAVRAAATTGVTSDGVVDAETAGET